MRKVRNTSRAKHIASSQCLEEQTLFHVQSDEVVIISGENPPSGIDRADCVAKSLAKY